MHLLDYTLIVALVLTFGALMLGVAAIFVTMADPRSARTRELRYTCIEEMRLRTRAVIDEESLRESLLRASWFVAMSREESALRVDGWMKEMGSLAVPFRYIVSRDGEWIVVQSCIPRVLVVAWVSIVVTQVLLWATLVSKGLESSTSGALMPLAVGIWALFVGREIRKRLRPMRQYFVIHATDGG